MTFRCQCQSNDSKEKLSSGYSAVFIWSALLNEDMKWSLGANFVVDFRGAWSRRKVKWRPRVPEACNATNDVSTAQVFTDASHKQVLVQSRILERTALLQQDMLRKN